MIRWKFPTMLAAITCVLFLAAGSASAQEAPQPLNSQDQYGDQIVRVNGLDELAELGISVPEDFDYCDEEGCHILGPSDKEFFFCDPNWQCEYLIWPSSALSAEDFDYFEVLAPAGRYPNGEKYGEYGFAYVCGSGEVCLSVATYQCDPSGECEYYSLVNPGSDRAMAGGIEDILPDAERDANRAYDVFRKALENSPSATRTALASENSVTSGSPPVNGESASTGSQDSGQSGSESGGSQGDSDEQASEGSRSDAEDGAAGDGNGNNSDQNGANGNGEDNSEQGSAEAGDVDSASSGSSGSDGGSSSSSSLSSGSVALGVGALALLAGGVVLAVRLFRS